MYEGGIGVSPCFLLGCICSHGFLCFIFVIFCFYRSSCADPAVAPAGRGVARSSPHFPGAFNSRLLFVLRFCVWSHREEGGANRPTDGWVNIE